MRLMRGKFIFTCFIIIVFLMSSTCFAENETGMGIFRDVPTDHWAYDAVSWMAGKQIITGYTDGTFKPNNPVTRAEFATIMVRALELNLKDPGEKTFADVSKNHWAYKYVETAKYYLTGYRTSTGDLFKPSDTAVREDMAVALVKAKGLANEDVNNDILNVFTDKEGISPNLKKFVAIAVKHEIMRGSNLAGSGLKSFNPQGVLTRAEAAVLLYNAIKNSEEKVTYSEEPATSDEKIEMGDERDAEHYVIPSVTGKVENGHIVIRWNKIEDTRFRYYKVVVSKDNPYPRYPEDGYLYYITDNNTTYAVIDNHEAYTDGDFGKYLVPGQKYYFSVTAVYEDIKLPGNAVSLVYPSNSESSKSKYTIPEVSAEVVGDKIVVSWKKIDSSRLNGYKVVLSKNNPSPKYPNDGYLQWITDKDTTSWEINAGDSYNGGDIGGCLEAGESYYISITALYDGMSVKVPGNVVKLKLP